MQTGRTRVASWVLQTRRMLLLAMMYRTEVHNLGLCQRKCSLILVRCGAGVLRMNNSPSTVGENVAPSLAFISVQEQVPFLRTR